MHIYNVCVIGGGPAGGIAAIRAGEVCKNVVLIERNNSICKKLLLTGKGRCNVTNTASLDTFIDKFEKQGPFLRSAFQLFFNQDLIDFFEAKGLRLKIERQGRVFPDTDEAESIVNVLIEYLLENKVNILYKKRVMGIKKKDDVFQVDLNNNEKISANKIILATGGLSYRETGSSGDGFNIMKRLGHMIEPLIPGLVPLKTKEEWVKELQGLSLRNIRIIFRYGNKKMVSPVGELMFTHFGVSGPLVLDLSRKVIAILERSKVVRLFIDLKPGLTSEQLNTKLLNEFKNEGNIKLKNYMKNLLPQKLVPLFMQIADIDPEKKTNQINQKERKSIINLLKDLPLTISGSLHIEEAMVTAGGISTREIDPKTMESKIVSGLYFAGEVIDGCASSGGYNLQQAFSTGYLAGERAALCVK